MTMKIRCLKKIIQRGIEKKYISLPEDRGKITYYCSRDYTTSFKNPEEKVRASYFAELVLDYKYPAKRIKFEDPIPRRTPEDRADIVLLVGNILTFWVLCVTFSFSSLPLPFLLRFHIFTLL
jgi:hypothetical protein